MLLPLLLPMLLLVPMLLPTLLPLTTLAALAHGPVPHAPTSDSDGHANSVSFGAAFARADADTIVMLRLRVRVPFPQLLVQLDQLPHVVTLHGIGLHSSAAHMLQLTPSGM